MSEIKNCPDGGLCRNSGMIEEMGDEIGELRVDNERLRETLDAYRSEIANWIEAGAAGAKLINEQHQRLRTIRALANARLADTAHMASIQEAETLWAIVAATEGE